MKIRRLVLAWSALCIALLFAPVMPAAAATLTFTDASCADFSVVDSGSGNFTVTCNFLAVPVCQMTPSNANPVVGTTITLNTACTGKPFGWLFSGTAVACSTVQSTCSDSQSNVGAVTYTVVGGNAAGRGPPATVTVNWQASAPLLAPSGCSLQASPSSLPTGGGATTLTVNCTGGGAPTNYAWNGGSLTASTTTNSQATNLTATTSFSVTPSNSAGSGNTASTSVSVAGTTTSLDFCTQYTSVVVVDIPWGGQAFTGGAAGSFFKAGVLVARFTVPANFTNTPGSKGLVAHAEYTDPPTFRQASLSTKACDFRGVAVKSTDKYTWSVGGGGVTDPLIWVASNSGGASFTVTGSVVGVPQLVPGQTYYYNIRNWSPYLNSGAGGVSCGGSTCNAIVSVATPL